MGCTLFVSGESVTMKGISPIGDRKYLGLGEKLQQLAGDSPRLAAEIRNLALPRLAPVMME